MREHGFDAPLVTRRKADGHFTMLANDALRDPRLSYRAKGILAAALSHSKDFRLTRDWIDTHGTEGRDAITTAIAELRALGYVHDEWTQSQDGKGRVRRQIAWTDEPVALPADQPPAFDGPENPSDGISVPLKTRATENPSCNKKTNSEEDQVLKEDQSIQGAAAAALGVKGPKRKTFRPKAEDIPAELQPVTAPLMVFWAEKSGSRSQQAWNLLINELTRIQCHRDGGMAVVRAQLEMAAQAGWRSVTFDNWDRYRSTRKAAAPFTEPRGCRPNEKTIAELAAEMEAMPLLSFNLPRP